MRENLLVPAAVFGALVGWVAHSLLDKPSVPVGSLITGAVAIFVGWQIQSALRRQTELNRVPLDSVARVCGTVDTWITQCLEQAEEDNPASPAVLKRLRMLANEIEWLGTVIQALNINSDALGELREGSHSFKMLLSDDVRVAAAAREGRKMRTSCLQIQWQICKRIVERPGDIGVLAGRGEER